MRGFVLSIANRVAIFCAQFWITDCDSRIDRRVTVDICRVVRQRAQRKGVLIGILAFKQQLVDKVPAAHVMRQVAELLAAEGIVGVGVSFFDLVFGKARKALQKEGPDLGKPK